MNYLDTIGQKIEKIRKLKGFSQEYIANKLRISQNSFSKIERGETKITLKKLNEICKVLEIDIEILKRFDPFQELKQLAEVESASDLIAIILSSFDRVVKLYEDLLIEKDERIKDLEYTILILKKVEQ